MVSIFSRLKNALAKTSSKLSTGIDKIFHKNKIDNETLEELEDLLIASDIGTTLARELVEAIKKTKFENSEVDPNLIKTKLAELISNEFAANDKHFELAHGLNVILVSGVNGNGKTTTIGKLSAKYISEGKKVAIAACDTFRAAAIEQIEHWANKTKAHLIKGDAGADPASVAYNAVDYASKNNYDILFIDTAGRLHNQQNLMDELRKAIRVIKKLVPDAPHHSILVLDATTGQNAYAQTNAFQDVAGVTGLIVTKLDGTAKAGSVVGISKKFNLPVYFIGIGEKVDDLKPFSKEDFARALIGLNDA